MIANGPAIQHDQAINVPRPGRRAITCREHLLIREVVDDEDLLVANPLAPKVLSHAFVDRDDPVGKPATDPFLKPEKPSH